MDYLERAQQSLENIPRYALYPLAALGALHIGKNLLNLSSFFYKNFLRPRFDLIQRYGKNSWAIVTGGGAGIGEEYCYQLAKLGFNIFIVGRSDNIIEVAQNVINEYKVQSKYLKVDLANYNDAVKQILAQTQGLDVSVIVNNAGIGLGPNYLHGHAVDAIENVYKINVLAPVLLTRHFMERLLARQNKSAVIFVSSAAGIYQAPFISTYSGSKNNIRAFAQAISEEYKGRVDVTVHCPGFVQTKMAAFYNGWDKCSVEETVSGTLDVLGREAVTLGAFKHTLYWRGYETLFGIDYIRSKLIFNKFKAPAEQNLAKTRSQQAPS